MRGRWAQRPAEGSGSRNGQGEVAEGPWAPPAADSNALQSPPTASFQPQLPLQRCSNGRLLLSNRFPNRRQPVSQAIAALPCGLPPSSQCCPQEPPLCFVKDSPLGPPTANRQPPPTANRHQPPTANGHQPPPTANRHQPPTIVQHRFCGVVSCPCVAHEAESVPVNVRFCWRDEPPPPFLLSSRTALLQAQHGLV